MQLCQQVVECRWEVSNSNRDNLDEAGRIAGEDTVYYLMNDKSVQRAFPGGAA